MTYPKDITNQYRCVRQMFDVTEFEPGMTVVRCAPLSWPFYHPALAQGSSAWCEKYFRDHVNNVQIHEILSEPLTFGSYKKAKQYAEEHDCIPYFSEYAFTTLNKHTDESYRFFVALTQVLMGSQYKPSRVLVPLDSIGTLRRWERTEDWMPRTIIEKGDGDFHAWIDCPDEDARAQYKAFADEFYAFSYDEDGQLWQYEVWCQIEKKDEGQLSLF